MRTSVPPVTSPRGRVWPVAVVVALVVIGATVAKAVVDAPGWVGWMPSTVTYGAEVAVLLAGTLTSAFSAWMVVPLRTSRTGEWAVVSSRTRAGLVRSAVLVPALTASVAVTLSLGAMVVWSSAAGATPTPAWPQTVLFWIGTLGAAVAFSTVGGLVGWWLRGPVAVVIAPALVYVLIILPQFTLAPPYWSTLYAVVGESWTENTPTVIGVAARAALWLALASLAVGALAAKRQVLAVALVATSVSVTIGLLDAPARAVIPQASSVVCQEGRPTVCTRGTWVSGLPRSAEIITEGYALLPEALVPQVISSDNGTGSGDTAPEVVFQVVGGFTAPTNVPDRDATLAALGEQVFLSSCQERSEPQLALVVWWRSSFSLSLTEDARAGDLVPAESLDGDGYERVLAGSHRVSQLSTADRAVWFTEHADKIASCALTATDLP